MNSIKILPLQNFPLIEPNDNLEDWFKALCARPAYKEHVMAVPLK